MAVVPGLTLTMEPSSLLVVGGEAVERLGTGWPVPVVGGAEKEPDVGGPLGGVCAPCGGTLTEEPWVVAGGCSGCSDAPAGSENPELEALDSREDRLLVDWNAGFSLSPTSRKKRFISITVSPKETYIIQTACSGL